MSALHDAYLKGACRLCEETELNSVDHEAASALHMRLEENISEMINGNSGDNKTERNEIRSKLNSITERLFNISFREYCGLNKQQEALHEKDEEIVKDNPSLLPNITDISVPESVQAGNTEPYTQESDLTKQTDDFLIYADTYITTLLQRIQKARKAFDNTRLRPQECTDAYTSFLPFSHPYIPSHDPTLLKAWVKLRSANARIQEVKKLFQSFCLEAQKASKRNSKISQELDSRLRALYSEIESIQLFVMSIMQERAVLKKNTSLGDIS